MRLESPIDKLLRYFRTKLVIPYVSPNMRICDLGCGVNPVLLKQLSTITVAKPVGIDFSVHNSSSANIELRMADLNKLPLPVNDKEFDLIIMLAVLEHLDNYYGVIIECFRGLKEGGKLMLTTPSPASKPLLEFLADLKIISRHGVYDHKKYFKKNEVFALLQQHGFIDIKIWSVACGLNTVAVATKPFCQML
ncbi:MAG TPA: hypothetical protein DEG23_05250 [Coxiellaceae bacterium]|nr:hypothetical protein [Coxiellaceae bacterium]